MKSILVLLGILILTTCTLQGPITVDATYPGDFKIVVVVRRSNWGFVGTYPSTPNATYHEEFSGGKDLVQVSVSAQKVGDLGTLEVSMSGDFGERRGTALVGDTNPINLQVNF